MTSMFLGARKGGIILMIFLLMICLVPPSLAGTKYLDGSPNMTAYITGKNQFNAGSDIQIPVVIKNTEMNTHLEVAPDIADRADIPTTAKFVTVTMSAGSAPIVIKTDPQMIGDLASQAQQTVTFSAKVKDDARGGTYSIPLTIKYTRLSGVDEYERDTFKNYYVTEEVTLTVPLFVKPEVIPEIVSVTADNLVAGEDGYLNVTLTNIGSFDGTKSTIRILQNGNSPITPVDSSVYIGDFPSGSTVSCKYKVAVSEDARDKTYPIDVNVIYQNDDGDFVTSQTKTTGVAVGNRVRFTVLSPPFELSPGSSHTIRVEYKNIGNSTIHNAEARVSAVAPFSSSADIAYIGELAPGQTAVASYKINVARDAPLKQYGLDSEIRYNNFLGDTYVSDPMKVSITVENLTGIQGIISNPVYLSLIAAVIIGIIYAFIHIRKKR